MTYFFVLLGDDGLWFFRDAKDEVGVIGVNPGKMWAWQASHSFAVPYDVILPTRVDHFVVVNGEHGLRGLVSNGTGSHTPFC